MDISLGQCMSVRKERIILMRIGPHDENGDDNITVSGQLPYDLHSKYVFKFLILIVR